MATSKEKKKLIKRLKKLPGSEGMDLSLAADRLLSEEPLFPEQLKRKQEMLRKIFPEGAQQAKEMLSKVKFREK